MRAAPAHRARSAPALAVAFAALFAALTGAASALPGRNTVDSGDIVNRQVKAPDLATKSVRTGKIANGHVKAPDLNTGAVTTGKIQDGTIRDIDVNDVSWNKLIDVPPGFADGIDNEGSGEPATDLDCAGCVDLADLADDSVNSAKIVNGQVANADLAPNAVGTGKVADGSLIGDDIDDGSLGAAELSFDPATQAELGTHKTSADHDGRYFTRGQLQNDGTINNSTNPVDWTKLKGAPAGFADGVDDVDSGPASDVQCTGCVQTADIDDLAVTSGKLGSNAVSSGKIVDDQVKQIDLARDSVSSSELAPGAVVTPHLGQVERLGTSSGERPLRLIVHDLPVLELEPARDFFDNFRPNVIAGAPNNSVEAGSIGGTVGGGATNTAGGFATVGGGSSNTASTAGATVAGGFGNEAAGLRATVGGGSSNEAGCCGDYATIAGGRNNSATTDYATVPGGRDNLAGHRYTFAAGRNAQAVHEGAFVWADSTPNHNYHSRRANQFRALATGGVDFTTALDSNGDPSIGALLVPGGSSWQSVSDRNSKENLDPVDPRQVLAALAEIPISTWNWKTEDDGIRHMGPMAQDFADAFGLGTDRKTISTVDADGVALAAIQGLNERNRRLEHRLQAERQKRVTEARQLRERIAALERQVGPNQGSE